MEGGFYMANEENRVRVKKEIYEWAIKESQKDFEEVKARFKNILAISTAAGAGTKKVTKSLKDNLFHWGVPKIYRYGKNVGAMGWETVKPEKKLQIEKEVRRLSKQISKQIGRVKPGIKTKLMFLIMRMGQKANDWNPTDKEYWIRNGWLNDKRPW